MLLDVCAMCKMVTWCGYVEVVENVFDNVFMLSLSRAMISALNDFYGSSACSIPSTEYFQPTS